MRRFLYAILCLVVFGRMANAAEPVDSTAMALATVWSEFISERNASDAPADSAAYMAGITEALKATQASDSRLRGIAEGMAMARQLSQMERQTGLKIDREVFASALQQAAQGNTAGFTRTSAEAYLDNMAAAAARGAPPRTARVPVGQSQASRRDNDTFRTAI